MARNGKSNKVRQEERQVRQLARLVENKGVTVRRENLSRGRAFRVKSGNCSLSGDSLLFVDRRLPPEQQSSFLIDYLLDSGVELSEDELEVVPPKSRVLFSQTSEYCEAKEAC